MASRIISSFENFKIAFPDLEGDEGSNERINALKSYFKNGGVVSLGNSSGGWPKLIYPHPKRINQQLKEIEDLRNIFSKKHSDWKEKEFDARIYYVKHEVLKLSEPLYWKHMGKMLIDKDYKEDVRLVKLPANLISDKRWKPMIKTFINDVEYRKQLVETVQHSIVYKKNKEVAVYAKELQDFRQGISTKKMDEIQQKLDSLNLEIKTMQQILKWSKE